jgi:methylenetetrahydrofolate dehydrogenase (NADP+)/methenyltetrahydrofolate cyclohydrolase
MTARIISGSEVAATIRQELKQRVSRLQRHGKIPCFGVLLVGDNPASISYVTSKERGAREIGMRESTIRMPANTTELKIIRTVEELNTNPDIDGILIQLPLPAHINAETVLNLISPEKDVDGSHPTNLGKILRGEPCPLPCTPHGVQQLLVRSGYDPGGKHVVICGRSSLVGKPLAAMLMQKEKGANATVTVVHTGTKDMAYFTRQADILVAAMGSPMYITAEMVREGAVVIDVGVNRVEDKTKERGYRLVGDVDFEAVKEKALAITPVPGGVGPMTVTMLLQNTIEVAERKLGIR